MLMGKAIIPAQVINVPKGMVFAEFNESVNSEDPVNSSTKVAIVISNAL